MAQLRLVKDLTHASNKVIDMIINAVMNGNTDSDNDTGVNGKPENPSEPPITPDDPDTTVGNNTISKFDPDKIYNAGDIAYIIVDGKIIIKECIQDGTTGGDFTEGWTVIEGSLGGSGGGSGSNTGTNTSTNFLELLEAISKVMDLSESNLEGIIQIPLYDDTDIKQIDGGIHEFGRIIF